MSSGKRGADIERDLKGDDGAELDWQFDRDTVDEIRSRKKQKAAGVVTDELDTTGNLEEADPDVQVNEEGVKFEPFNMRQEMEEGNIDEEGNFLFVDRKKQEEDFKDSWLDSVDGGAASTTFKNDDERRAVMQRMNRDAEVIQVDVPTSLAALIQVLQPGETPTAALRRIKAGGETTKGGGGGIPGIVKGRNKKGGRGSTEREGGKEHRMTDEEVATFNRVTELCDGLMAEGSNAYFMTREEIEEALKKHSQGRGQRRPAAGGGPVGSSEDRELLYWQYRWKKPSAPGAAQPSASSATPSVPDSGQLYGPFTSESIMEWIRQGFISEGNPVEVRQVTSSNDPVDGMWRDWSSVDFSVAYASSAEKGVGGSAGQGIDDDDEAEEAAMRERDEERAALLGIAAKKDKKGGRDDDEDELEEDMGT